MSNIETLKKALRAPEMHDALCPALTGGKCACSESPTTVDKAWSQFCGEIGRGPDAPYPGMIEAFEAHYGQSFSDKDWRNETGVWAAAWVAASRLVRESVLEEAAAQCRQLADCEENTEGYRNGAAWCAERIKGMK